MTSAPPTLDYASPPRQLRLPGRRGLFALGDQAVLSLGNFLTNLVLLQNLPRDTYGNYGTVLTILLFLNNLHTAVVTYPLSITAGLGDEGEFRRRTRRAIGFTLLLTLPFSIALAAPTAKLIGWTILPAVIVALVLWQIQETLRRAMLAQLRHDRAILGDLISYPGQAALVWLLKSHGLSLSMVFWIIAATSGLSIIVQCLQLRLFSHAETIAPPQTFAGQAAQHWSLGNWVLSANLVNVLTVYSIPWVIRYSRGPGEAAAFYAVLALLNASNPVLSSVAGLITPAVAKVAGPDLTAARHVTVRYAVGGAALLVPFFLVLAVVPHWVLSHAYHANSPYVTLGLPMRLFTASYLLTYTSAMFASYLCGLGKSKLPFYGQAANALVTLVLTLPLATRFGVTGAAIGSVIAIGSQLAINAVLTMTRGLLSSHSPAPSPGTPGEGWGEGDLG